MKKTAKLIGVIFLALLFLSACGSGGGDGNSNSVINNPNNPSNPGNPNNPSEPGENPVDTPESYLAYGINFSCYTLDGQDPNRGSRVTPEQIEQYLKIVFPYTYWIRTFGSTLGMEDAARIASDLGFSTAIGAWLGTDKAANDQEMENLITAAKAGYVDLAFIGNEALLRGDLTIDELIDYIEWFKSEVPDVPVATAETYDVWLDNLDLIDYVDVITVNFYPFWEGIQIDQAIPYIHNRYQQMLARSRGKQVIVTETGWPSDGDPIGDAVPNLENAVYHFLDFVSWARAEGVDYFYFEAFDEPWKEAYEGPHGSHWGIWDKDGNLKAGMERVFNGETLGDNWSGDCVPGGPGDPMIEFTYVPPIGSYEYLEGQVSHVDANLSGVAVYIYVNGWWTKPTWAKPITVIDCAGKFSTDITTGGIDQKATKVAAFLIPTDYDPPSMGGGKNLPDELFNNSYAYVIVDR